MEKHDKMLELREECLSCRRCGVGGCLINGKIANVFSNMNTDAEIMVVGQNPGRDEVDQGVPFVGVSGKFFDKALKEVLDIDRSNLYISNTVRCFTPENRRPHRSEIENCRYFLEKEIEILKPKCIVTLGGPSLKEICGLSGIRKHHGKLGVSVRYKCHVLPLYHPSPLNMNQEENRIAFYEDIETLKKFLGTSDSDEKCHWCNKPVGFPVVHGDKNFCSQDCVTDQLEYEKDIQKMV